MRSFEKLQVKIVPRDQRTGDVVALVGTARIQQKVRQRGLIETEGRDA